jgi:DnaJ-domain-containing protein 1
MLLRFIILAVIAYFLARWIQKLLSPTPAGAGGAVPPSPRPPESERSPYEVLGVPRDATQDEIRTAYQRLVRENHPDRVADMAQEIRELAERRTKEINRAYERLKRP